MATTRSPDRIKTTTSHLRLLDVLGEVPVVIPLWMCSVPARSANSSMRALTL